MTALVKPFLDFGWWHTSSNDYEFLVLVVEYILDSLQCLLYAPRLYYHAYDVCTMASQLVVESYAGTFACEVIQYGLMMVRSEMLRASR